MFAGWRVAQLSAGLALVLALACSQEPPDPYVELCVGILEQSLRSPATLELVTVEHDGGHDARHSILIAYDAANVFGVPIRGSASCEYPADPWWTVEGEVPTYMAERPLLATSLYPDVLVFGADTHRHGEVTHTLWITGAHLALHAQRAAR